MGNPPQPRNVQDLLKARGEAYGSTWKVSGELVHWLSTHGYDFQDITILGYLYAWIIISCKLIRAIKTPQNIDHWRDIEGYAHLVVQDLEDYNGIPSE